MEKVDGRIASTRAKAIGTAVSVSGALLAVLYKGPEIISPRSAVAPVLSFPHPLQTSTTNWALGGGLLTVENLLNSSAFILMRHIVMMYPNLLTMSFLNNLFVTIITIPVSFLVDVIGAVILLLGFYAVLWGKAKEEKSMDCTGSDISGEASDGKTPLLRSPSQENV
ncbi:hypothetical protein TIFTF001_011674 [Ficus carica]|uniref:WAT1-related protein n=1 Tax=Ficus carica TaxID=3494 RepID=A0AA88D5L0_FICCA|nr:hypothetical protein TIFTF001_011674 [Ficus carica]